MKRNICFFLRVSLCSALLFIATSAYSQVEVSLLTCQPHDEVYSLYGHTAIRVQNHKTGADIAINYGVFDPTIDYFVPRFVFGLTDYSMGVCSYQDFLDEYHRYGSGVYEQHINMSEEEKRDFLAALLENSRPENVVYRYNYFYNNCTTKARDIILNAIPAEIEYTANKYQQGERSFRQLVHLKTSLHPWAQWGNDLLLGFQADVDTEHDEREFLPEVLSSDFQAARIVYPDGREKALVDSAFWALQPGKAWQNPDNIDFPLTPLRMSWIFLFLVIAYCLFEFYVLMRTSRGAVVAQYIRYFFFCLYALVGIILFLMLFSQHPTVRLNFQIFIFNPFFFFLALPRVWKGRRIIFLSILMFFLGNLVQDYAEGVNVLAVAALVLCIHIWKKEDRHISLSI